MARPSQLTLCSFCGKSHAEVKKLIQGPGVYICDSCIVVCKSVLDKELRADNKKNVLKLKVPRPCEIKRQLERLAGLPALLDFPGAPPPPGGGESAGALRQNFPNPFRDTTTIGFEVVDGGDVEIVVYDLQGREIVRLVDGFREPGEHSVDWDGRSAADREVAAGIYVIRMTTSAGTSTIRALKVP